MGCWTVRRFRGLRMHVAPADAVVITSQRPPEPLPPFAKHACPILAALAVPSPRKLTDGFDFRFVGRVGQAPYQAFRSIFNQFVVQTAREQELNAAVPLLGLELWSTRFLCSLDPRFESHLQQTSAFPTTARARVRPRAIRSSKEQLELARACARAQSYNQPHWRG